jgi:hypothetical protein
MILTGIEHLVSPGLLNCALRNMLDYPREAWIMSPSAFRNDGSSVMHLKATSA